MATLQMNILSLTLGMQMNFSVFLPSFVPARKNALKSYEELYPRGERFKTLWLLGTEYGDDAEILRNTGIARYAQEHNMAVVFPCGNNRLYSEDPKGQKYLRHITEELWTICTGTFALSQKREDNFISGVSLGAYAALKAALRNPDKYSKVILFGGVFQKDIKNTYFADLCGSIAADGLAPHFALDDAEEDDAELVCAAEAVKAAGKELPRVSVSWREGAEFAPYAERAAENMKNFGFTVREKKYETQELWDFCDRAIRTELREFLCAEQVGR